MRKSLAAGIGILALAAAMQPAAAADMPVKAPVYRPILVDPWTWSGVYVGVNVGYSWGRSDTHVDFFDTVTGAIIAPPPGSVTDVRFDLDGWIGGGQIGANLQVGSLGVLGIEADIQWSGQKGGADFVCAPPTGIGGIGTCIPSQTGFPIGTPGATLSLEQKLQWFGTLRGRAGLLFGPSVFGYLTGGLAYGQVKTEGTLTGLGVAPVVPVSAAFSHSETQWGWTVGVGIEGRLGGNWTGKIEYLYMDLGEVSGTVLNTPALIGATYSSRITDNILRVGINYKFGPEPVVARY
jgi:outer membrane immunogenic protein